MITREDLRQLAQVESPEGCAVSFFFQPQTPQNKSHKEEAILVKDLVRNALRAAERQGNHCGARADLERILAMAEHLQGNRARGKAVFACAEQGLWREFDLPALLPETQVVVKYRFHLRPLVPLVGAPPRCCVALLDREHGRLFTLQFGEMVELAGVFDSLPRIGRSDGFAGYDAGHLDRRYDNEAIRHFKNVSERLRQIHQRQNCEAVILGCRDEVWSGVEPHLHVSIKQHLLGRFSIDPATATPEQVRQKAERIIHETAAAEHQGLVREVLGQAQRNGRGSVGLRHVLNSLERGEVQAILLGDKFSGAAVECRNCGHLDPRMVKNCAACGSPTRELEDVTDAVLARTIGGGIDLVYVRDNPDFEKVGNIGALLRFRADQNTPGKLAS
jgi:hypothetical protein